MNNKNHTMASVGLKADTHLPRWAVSYSPTLAHR